ncbi:TPA: hypothetical protein SLN67_004420 [Serratia marcescens]|nr:hypothetical protein [Serratia marcescens]
MANFTFADRYSEAGLAPSSQMILSRQEPAKRIIADIAEEHIIDLADFYYGNSNVNLEWFRDEFAQEDASFSLINNEREARVLAALILGQLINDENAIAILAVSIGSVRGLRTPPQSTWLLNDAEETLVRLSVSDRIPEEISTKITPTAVSKLNDEITALSENVNDWAALVATLGKIRSEAQSSAKTTAVQATNALNALVQQTQQMREESQMLWWLFSGHSRSLECSFATLVPQKAAIAGAIDLGVLTTYSPLGPIAVPAMLELIITSSKKVKGKQSLELASAVDSFTLAELALLDIPTQLPARLAPITSAIDLARNKGIGSWHEQFLAETGLPTSQQLEPILLAEQLYREHLLGQLL